MQPRGLGCGWRSRGRPCCRTLLSLAAPFCRAPFAPGGGTQSRPPGLANEHSRFGAGGQGEKWAGPFPLTSPPSPSLPGCEVFALEAIQFDCLRLSPGTCCQAKKGKNNPSRRRVSGSPRPA